MSFDTSISTDKLSRLISITIAPALVDVRIDDGFAADPRRIPGATRRPHLDQSHRRHLPDGRQAERRHGGLAPDDFAQEGWSE